MGVVLSDTDSKSDQGEESGENSGSRAAQQQPRVEQPPRVERQLPPIERLVLPTAFHAAVNMTRARDQEMRKNEISKIIALIATEVSKSKLAIQLPKCLKAKDKLLLFKTLSCDFNIRFEDDCGWWRFKRKHTKKKHVKDAVTFTVMIRDTRRE